MIFPQHSSIKLVQQSPHTLHIFRSTVFCLLCLLIITSCGTAPKKPIPPPMSQISRPDVPVETDSVNNWLEKASNSYGREQHQALLSAAEAYQEQHCVKSVTIIELLQPEIQDPDLNSLAHLIWAECLLEMQRSDEAFGMLDKITSSPDVAERKYRLEAALYNSKYRWWQAAEKLANIPNSDRQQSEQIWGFLENLSTSELQEKVSQPSLIQPMLQLLLIQRSYATEPDKLQMAVQEWQSRYNWHTFAHNPPQKLIQLLNTPVFTPNKLGIILPLTGKLASQGTAIKDGILAGYFAQQERNNVADRANIQPELVFIDSNISETLLPEQFVDLDFVLGPLLKENIAKFAPYVQSPWLALNFVDKSQTLISSSQQFYFALSPEDEGIQMARHLKERGLKKPLIIKADNSGAQRMSQAFIAEWSQYSLETAEEVVFTDNRTMRTGISDLLAVAKSKQRIKEVERLIIKEVHTFERSRRDADAIVIFANASQTELITPYIEANTSPFADILPVFASSRSHSTRKNMNSLRDLRDLMFLDMPWMLPEQNFQNLKNNSQVLWPKRRDNNQRLFAMGYDAFHLISHLRALQILPNYRYEGLTGSIYMDPDKQLRRQLLWGQVKDEKVVRITMD